MTKKNTPAQEALDALDVAPVASDVEQAKREHAENLRRVALERALDHHRINGGMLTAQQLLENAKLFNAYIKGELQ